MPARGLLINEQESWEDSAIARRVTLVDNLGSAFTTNNPLPVDTELIIGTANLEIQNINSKLWNGTTYVGVTSDNRLKVSTENNPDNTSIEFQNVGSVPTNTETTVLSFTNTGNDLFIDGIGGEGNARSEWFIYVNTTLKAKRRSGVANMNIEIPMYGFKVENGDIIDIKVKHYESGTRNYNAEVRYHR